MTERYGSYDITKLKDVTQPRAQRTLDICGVPMRLQGLDRPRQLKLRASEHTDGVIEYETEADFFGNARLSVMGSVIGQQNVWLYVAPTMSNERLEMSAFIKDPTQGDLVEVDVDATKTRDPVILGSSTHPTALLYSKAAAVAIALQYELADGKPVDVWGWPVEKPKVDKVYWDLHLLKDSSHAWPSEVFATRDEARFLLSCGLVTSPGTLFRPLPGDSRYSVREEDIYAHDHNLRLQVIAANDPATGNPHFRLDLRQDGTVYRAVIMTENVRTNIVGWRTVSPDDDNFVTLPSRDVFRTEDPLLKSILLSQRVKDVERIRTLLESKAYDEGFMPHVVVGRDILLYQPQNEKPVVREIFAAQLYTNFGQPQPYLVDFETDLLRLNQEPPVSF